MPKASKSINALESTLKKNLNGKLIELKRDINDHLLCGCHLLSTYKFKGLLNFKVLRFQPE